MRNPQSLLTRFRPMTSLDETESHIMRHCRATLSCRVAPPCLPLARPLPYPKGDTRWNGVTRTPAA
jgi:hypothetical protein